jgi:3-methyl-2-oxobutanoate hydroxymethyltransferase
VQARGTAGEERLAADARALSDAGVAAIVLEMIPGPVTARVTAEIPVPTIGIGAGAGCSGQVLVLYDLIGLSGSTPRFARPYGDAAGVVRGAVGAYAADVRAGRFPGPAETHDGRGWGVRQGGDDA